MKIEIGPYPETDGEERVVNIHIDKYDTWSMDHTLSMIIVPMLKQLHATKHGAPCTDDDDVPEELRSTNATKDVEWHTDSNHFKRWDWIMSEMIWTFEQLASDGECYDQFYKIEKNTDPNSSLLDKVEIDHDGLDAMQARITNGTRLFGKYYQNLWD
jgi:hypothetical protein